MSKGESTRFKPILSGCREYGIAGPDRGRFRGKSGIFDAVTFALFGHHRGGSQSATELINKDSNTLSVEFDFTLDKQLYRIKRTARRRTSGIASTQQVMKHVKAGSLLSETALQTEPSDRNGQASTDDPPQDDWEAIPDTTYKTRFDSWVRDKIGFDYETFTSSVLLLQGRSEKLLDSTPSGRASVLARIVELERYQKLQSVFDDLYQSSEKFWDRLES